MFNEVPVVIVYVNVFGLVVLSVLLAVLEGGKAEK